MLEVCLKRENKVMLIQSSAATISKEAKKKENKVLIDVLLQCISAGKFPTQCTILCSKINCDLWRWG